MSKTKDFTLGLLTGAAIGTVTALLYAPEKGSNTRDILSYKLSSYLDELTKLIDKLSKEKEFISDAKRKGDEVVEDARRKAEDLINEAENLLSSIEETKEKAEKKLKEESK